MNEQQAVIVRSDPAFSIAHGQDGDVPTRHCVDVARFGVRSLVPVAEVPGIGQRVAVGVRRVSGEGKRHGGRGQGRGIAADGYVKNRRRAVRLSNRDGEGGDRHECDDQDRGDAAPRPAVRTVARRNIDASSLRVRHGLHTTPFRAGSRGKGESTLIVYQTKLEPMEVRCAARSLRDTGDRVPDPRRSIPSARTRVRLQSFNYAASVGRATPG